MAAKKTRLEILNHAESLVDELDGLVWSLVHYEEALERGGELNVKVAQAKRPTPKAVQKVQNKSNELWRTLESYRNRVVKERP